MFPLHTQHSTVPTQSPGLCGSNSFAPLFGHSAALLTFFFFTLCNAAACFLTKPKQTGSVWLPWAHSCVATLRLQSILTPHRDVLQCMELPWVVIMISYCMVHFETAIHASISAERVSPVFTVGFLPALRWTRKTAKVTSCEPQWSHLSCCSILVWVPADHSHLDRWRRSQRSCQSACRPRKMTRRWLEEKERGQKSVFPLRISPRSDSSPMPESPHCTRSILIYTL